MEKEKLDAEEREVLRMTRAELEERAERGIPARLAKKPPRRVRKANKQGKRLVKSDRGSSR
jgi:hypothetical protein